MNKPELSNPNRLDEIIAEYLAAVEGGTVPGDQDLIDSHPEFAEALNEFLADKRQIDQLANVVADPDEVETAVDNPITPADAMAMTIQPAQRWPGRPESDYTNAPWGADGANAIGKSIRYFGDYELLAEIARGGMGVVYKARQVSLNRIVALKMILAGQLASEADIRRFQTEAEAAAKLDHPGIVPIFEVGKHHGQHYFSMAYVEGESLAERLARGPLPSIKAAELVRKVAQAVAYAHDHGVIHRDLKPGNILLQHQVARESDSGDQARSRSSGSAADSVASLTMAEPSPRITDFGLAKRTDIDSNLTGTGQILGTPGYMAPEQANGSIVTHGPAADIYALGAILYCALTGRPPFQAATPIDTLIQVVNNDPISPQQLNPAVPHDLETICLKCLEKDSQKRYQTGIELAEELQRFLEGKPIVARPVGRTERAWRWCRRRPVVAGLIAAVVVAMIFGTTFSTYFAARAHTAQLLAEENLQKAHKVVDTFFLEVSESPELLRGTPGTQELRKRLLNEARAYYEEFVQLRADDPASAIQLAYAHFRLGTLYADTGESTLAVDAFAAAAEGLQKLSGNLPAGEVQSRLAQCYRSSGALHGALGNSATALEYFSMALEIQRQLASEFVNAPEYQNAVALTLGTRSKHLALSGKKTEAIADILAACEIAQTLTASFPDRAGIRGQRAAYHNNLASLYRETGAVELALNNQNLAIEIDEGLIQDYPQVQEYRAGLASSLQNRGVLNDHFGKREAAITDFQRAIEISARLASENPTVTDYQSLLAKHFNSIALLYKTTNQLDKSSEAFQEAISLKKKLATENPGTLEYQIDLATSHSNAANLYRNQGNVERALEALREAIHIQSQLIEQDSATLSIQRGLASSFIDLASLQSQLALPEKAAESINKSIGMWEKLSNAAPENIEFRDGMAIAYTTLGTLQNQVPGPYDPVTAFERAREIWADLSQQNPGISAYQIGHGGSLCNIANGLASRGKSAESLECYDKAIDALRNAILLEPGNTKATRYLLNSLIGRAMLFVDLNDSIQALTAYEEALPVCKALADQFPDDWSNLGLLANIQHNLGVLYAEHFRLDEARKSYQSGIDIQTQLVQQFPKRDDYQTTLARQYHNFGNTLDDLDANDEAMSIYNKAFDIARTLVARHPEDIELQVHLGASYCNVAFNLIGDEKFDDALPLLDQAITTLNAAIESQPRNTYARSCLANSHVNRAMVFTHLRQFDEADKEWAIAILTSPDRKAEDFQMHKALVLAHSDQHDMASSLALDLSDRVEDPILLYNAACVLSLSSRTVKNDSQLSDANRALLADEYARRAVELLGKARSRGYFVSPDRLQQMHADSDLDSIRERPEFKSLIDELDTKGG